VLDVIPQRIDGHMVSVDPQESVHLLVHPGHIVAVFLIHQVSGGADPPPVGHVVTPCMHHRHVVYRDVQISPHDSVHGVIVGPRAVIREVDDAHLVVFVHHVPGAVIPRPVGIRGRPDEFAVGHRRPGALVCAPGTVLIGGAADQRVHHRVLRHGSNETGGKSERVADQHPLHPFKFRHITDLPCQGCRFQEVLADLMPAPLLFGGHPDRKTVGIIPLRFLSVGPAKGKQQGEKHH